MANGGGGGLSFAFAPSNAGSKLSKASSLVPPIREKLGPNAIPRYGLLHPMMHVIGFRAGGRASKLCSSSAASDASKGPEISSDSPPVQPEMASEADLKKKHLVNGYGVAACLFLASACAQLAVPQKMAEITTAVSLLGTNEYLLRMLGVCNILNSIFMHAVSEAARKDLLGSQTYKRLAWWMALYFAMGNYVIVNSNLSFSLASMVIRGVPLYFFLSFFWKAYDEIPILAIIPDTITAARSILQPKNLISGILAALTFLKITVGSLLVFFPEKAWEMLFGLTADQYGVMMARMLGLGTWSVAVGAYSLKDAADRGRLGASTFKTITGGLLVISIASLVMTSAVYPNMYAQNVKIGKLVADSLSGAFLAFLFFTQKK